nr:hypothetical protein [Streptomyces fulvoviolaceus]
MRRGLVSAAMAAGMVVGAVQPAAASGDPYVVRPDDRRLTYEGHWGRTAEAAVTVNSGSRLRFRFVGGSVHALFDVSSITVPAQIYVSVDGGPKQLHTVDQDDLEITAGGRGPHTVEISVKDVFSRVNRWTPPLETGVVLTGIRGHVLDQRVRHAPELAFYGDSVTQGVMALCDVNTSDCADGTAAYPTLVADALHVSLTQVGFGRQGVIQTGNGGVPAASDAYGWNCAGSRADSDRRADVIVVNQAPTMPRSARRSSAPPTAPTSKSSGPPHRTPASSPCARSTAPMPPTSRPWSVNSPTHAPSSSTRPAGSTRRRATSTAPSTRVPRATARRPTD